MKEQISDKVLKIESKLKPFLSKNKEVSFETKEDLVLIFKDLFLDKKPHPLLDWFKENSAFTGFLGAIMVGIISTTATIIAILINK